MSTLSWTTLASEDLLVSIEVPIGWTADPDGFLLTLHGPGDGGYAPTVTLQAGEPEEPGRAWFEEFAASVAPRLEREVPGFELLGTDRFELSSLGSEVYAVRGRRPQDDVLPATTQLQAYVWAGSYRMLSFGGSTLTGREAEDLPVFDRMLRSLRLLPPRP